MTTALQPAKSTGLEVWASRDDVRELQKRLKLMLPGGQNLKDDQLLALAQGAVAHGLDPLNGEIWMIPGRGLMVGVKGLRKKAREQVRGNFWIDFREIDNPEERQRLRIPEKALAYEARLYDSENIRTYADAVSEFTKRGIPFEHVAQIIGTRPFTVGIGVLKAGENTKMEPSQCAMKRAEADALKRRFDVPFGLNVADESASGGDWAISNGTEQSTDYYDPTQVEAEIKSKQDTALWGE